MHSPKNFHPPLGGAMAPVGPPLDLPVDVLYRPAFLSNSRVCEGKYVTWLS